MNLDLKITEVAYYKLLDLVLPDDIPVLNYADGVCTITKTDTGAINNVYEVGRIVMVIDDVGIIEQVSGKILDYVNDEYIIREIR